MYTQVKNIPNVQAYDPASGIYSNKIQDREGIVLNKEWINLPRIPLSILTKNDILLFTYGNGITELWSYGKRKNEFDNAYFTASFFTEFINKYNFNFDELINYENLININSGASLLDKSIPYNLFHIKNKIIAVNKKKEIKQINKDTSTIWHFPLSTIAPLPHDTDTPDTVSEIIGVASQKLWVTTEAGRLLVLDIETGELLKIFSHHESDKKQGYTYNEGFGSIYIKENDDDYLYCMGNTSFSIINANTIAVEERVKYKELNPDMKQFEYVYSPLLQGDYFTFIGRKHGESGGIRHVGIFDYTAKKLVWQYQVISEEEIAKGNELIAPEPLYISGNKLYIKDFHQTLHIFEKEEQIS